MCSATSHGESGYFNFNDKTLTEIMRELSHWYDLSIVYDAGVKEAMFVGEVPRSLTLKEVLKGYGRCRHSLRAKK